MKAQKKTAARGDTLVRTVRSQAKWLLGWGVVNLIIPPLSSPFGILLIITGLMSYYFGTASMLIVQAVIFLWAAVSNLFVGEVLATSFSVIIVISFIQTVRQYRRYRSVEPGRSATVERAARILPLGAFLVAGIAWAGLATAFVFNISWFMATGEEEVPSFISFTFGLFLELGALAIALGLASVFSGYRYKALSILGVLGGAGILMLTILLAALA